MRYTTEYNPQISTECKKFIRDNINPAYTAEDTEIYYLDFVYEALSEILKEPEEELLGIKAQDFSVLKSLIDENVSHIEF
jgi:hypothetical protein